MSFTSLLIDTCAVKKYSSSNEYGRITHGSAGSSVACRFNPQEGKRIVNQVGDEEIIDGTLFIAASVSLDAKDLIVFGGSDYRIINIKTQKDSAAAHHKQIFLRKV